MMRIESNGQPAWGERSHMPGHSQSGGRPHRRWRDAGTATTCSHYRIQICCHCPSCLGRSISLLGRRPRTSASRSVSATDSIRPLEAGTGDRRKSRHRLMMTRMLQIKGLLELRAPSLDFGILDCNVVAAARVSARFLARRDIHG